MHQRSVSINAYEARPVQEYATKGELHKQMYLNTPKCSQENIPQENFDC